MIRQRHDFVNHEDHEVLLLLALRVAEPAIVVGLNFQNGCSAVSNQPDTEYQRLRRK